VSEARPRSLLLAVPTTGGLMKAGTAESLANLMKVLTQNGIDADLRNIDGSDIVTVRNAYANMVLESDRWDALLFIDSDMKFAPRVVSRLIQQGAPIAAAACTKRDIDLRKFGQAMIEHGDFERARAESSFFNTLIRWDNRRKVRLQRRGGFYTMAAVGMAVCLIRKAALHLMVERGAVEQRTDIYDGVARTSWGFFDFVKLGKATLTEDYSFCYRWTKLMEQPLWVLVDEPVIHIGDFPYGGRYGHILDRLAASAPEPKSEG